MIAEKLSNTQLNREYISRQCPNARVDISDWVEHQLAGSTPTLDETDNLTYTLNRQQDRLTLHLPKDPGEYTGFVSLTKDSGRDQTVTSIKLDGSEFATGEYRFDNDLGKYVLREVMICNDTGDGNKSITHIKQSRYWESAAYADTPGACYVTTTYRYPVSDPVPAFDLRHVSPISPVTVKHTGKLTAKTLGLLDMALKTQTRMIDEEIDAQFGIAAEMLEFMTDGGKVAIPPIIDWNQVYTPEIFGVSVEHIQTHVDDLGVPVVVKHLAEDRQLTFFERYRLARFSRNQRIRSLLTLLTAAVSSGS